MTPCSSTYLQCSGLPVYKEICLEFIMEQKIPLMMRTKDKTHRSNSKNNMQENCKMLLRESPENLK